MKQLMSRTIKLRLVEEEDAEFILSLRNNKEYNKYISYVDSNVDAQKKWIKSYKAEESIGKQFYFLILNNDGKPCGTVRVYDLKEDSFCWGSWILNNDKTRYAALESAFLVYKFGFEHLNFKKSHFDVMKGNEKVISFHEKMGAVKTGEDDLNYFFEVDKQAIDNFFEKMIGKIV